jgi:uncharacterized protein RhaS with RHS repeats
MDSESDFYYLRARYYDPVLAQFLSVDPLVEATQMPYAYVAGDPINEFDLDGMAGCGFNPICNVEAAGKTLVQAAVTAGSGVCEVATFAMCSIPAAVLERTSAALGTSAALIDTGSAATGNGSWRQVGLDMLGVVPGVG